MGFKSSFKGLIKEKCFVTNNQRAYLTSDLFISFDR